MNPIKTSLKPIFALEVQPLLEKKYTGIPRVALAYAKKMLADDSIEARFFIGENWVHKDVIKIAIQEESGEILSKTMHLYGNRVVAHEMKGRTTAALFPNFKSAHRIFNKEAFILHDMSVFDLPDCHTQENIRKVSSSLLMDCESSDYIVAVSQATKKEFIKFDFLKAFEDKIKVVYNGVDLPPLNTLAFLNSTVSDKKTISVLGTLEPRKSIERVLAFFSKNPNYFQKFQLKIVGKVGWGEDLKTLISKHALEKHVELGDVRFEGFVTEETKDKILSESHLMVYPSIYEGFGLPVAEALVRGVNVLTSNKTSLPEVGGEHAYYYDPEIADDFEKKMHYLLDSDLKKTDANAKRQWILNNFDWNKSYLQLKNLLIQEGEK